MITTLLPYLKLYKHYFWPILLGTLLAITTLASSIFLLSLSGWFLASTAFIGVAGLYTFNYMLPAAGVRAAAIMRTAMRYFERLVDHNTTFKILADLRTLAFKKILPLSANQLEQYQKADLLNRFIADIDNLDHLYLRLFSPIISALIIIGLLFAGLSLINLQIALVITLILGITVLTLPVIFYRASRHLGEALAHQKSAYRQALIAYFQGQTELTLFNAKQAYRHKLDEQEKSWLKNQQRQSNLLAISSALIILIVGLLTLVVLWLIASTTSSPLIALFVFITLASTEILIPIPGAFIFLEQVLTSAKRTTQLFNQTPDITFNDSCDNLNLSLANLQISHLNFAYPNQPFNVLHNFSLTVNQGEHIAIVGTTGCGKSTLLKLITRTQLLKEGEIRINGIDISSLSEQTLRQSMSVVPQTITIFSDTLRQNLLIGHANANDQQIIDVLQRVELDKLLLTKQGLDLWLGDSGRPLSGGEIRRIGIARALLHNAPLILMDEPTENLDNETELAMLALIKHACEHKTLIMVTHRLTDSPWFDRVIEM